MEFTEAKAKLDGFIELQTMFSRRAKVDAVHKVLYSVYRGVATPNALIERLNISKGNLANYCKRLNEKEFITQSGNNRGIRYEVTAKGKEKVNKLLSVITENIIKKEK